MNDSIVINKIKLLRRQRCFTQKEISAHLHLSRSAYANYEAGKRHMTPEILVSIARFYRISLDSLLRNEFDTTLPFPILSDDLLWLLQAYSNLAPAYQKKVKELICHLHANSVSSS